jgi:diguanylate cyclase (GGDEF)-like protein
MQQTAMSRRAWRLDRTDSSPDPKQSGQQDESRAVNDQPVRGVSSGTAETSPRRRAWSTGFWRVVRDRLTARLRRSGPVRVEFEEMIHEFAALIDQADDPVTVEGELLRVVRRMAPSSRIELVGEPEVDPRDDPEALSHGAPPGRAREPRQTTLEIPLRCGSSICGRLRIHARPGTRSSYSPEEMRRLTTIATIAACAMEGLGLFTEWPEDRPSSDVRPNVPAGDRASGLVRHPAVQLQDATFLNAVLPFALSQARRHREPLSIVCIAIDRLSAVKQLLGKTESDRLVRHVAQVVGTMIRSSDIVARLDDDRVVAVLPRAPRGGAMHVAEKICRSVHATGAGDCGVPSVTVSIGVATYPSCADDVYSLFDAADEALACAQRNGRSQAVLAHPRSLAEGDTVLAIKI